MKTYGRDTGETSVLSDSTCYGKGKTMETTKRSMVARSYVGIEKSDQIEQRGFQGLENIPYDTVMSLNLSKSIEWTTNIKSELQIMNFG